MKPTIDINLGGMLFHLDDDAYKALQSYLKALDKHLQTVDGRQEILSDIESRIAELLTERLASTRQVVSMLDVDAVKETLGSPSEFGPDPVDEPSQGYSEPHDPSARSKRPYRRLYRDDQDRVVGGVASGIAAFFNWDPLGLAGPLFASALHRRRRTALHHPLGLDAKGGYNGRKVGHAGGARHG